ncbi:MAG: hypothetical protein N3A54_05200, partial [Patescibacteria group bacterium]|nr:hypothetical protein [Patescibacteria group bacterium]
RSTETVTLNLSLIKLITRFEDSNISNSIVFLVVKDRIVDNSYDLIYLLPDEMYEEYTSKLDIDFSIKEREFIERIMKDNDLYDTYVERIYISVPSGRIRRFQMLKFNVREGGPRLPDNVPPEDFYNTIDFMNKRHKTDLLNMDKTSLDEIVKYLKKLGVIPERVLEEILEVDNIKYFINTRFYGQSLFVLNKAVSRNIFTENLKLVDGEAINSMLFVPDNAPIDTIFTVDSYEKYMETMKKLKNELSQKGADENLFNVVKEHVRKTIIDLLKRLDIPLFKYSLEVVPINKLRNYNGEYIIFPSYTNLGAITMEYNDILNMFEVGLFSKKVFDNNMAKLGITDYVYSFGLKDLMEMVYGMHLATSHNSIESLNQLLEISPEKISKTLAADLSMTMENMIQRCGPLFNHAPLVNIPNTRVYSKLSRPPRQYLIVKIST